MLSISANRFKIRKPYPSAVITCLVGMTFRMTFWDFKGVSREDLKGDLEGDSKGDFRGNFKQDLEWHLLSGSIYLPLKFNTLELDTEVGKLVSHTNRIQIKCTSLHCFVAFSAVSHVKCS